jgi:anti-sigma factor RsiW
MTPEPTNEELRELLGAYALDALDPDERVRVDEFLLTDAAARAELHELEHAAAWLGHASLRPPASAWNAIAAEVADDLGQTPAAEPAPVPAPVPEPVPLAPPVQAPSRRGTRWLVAAAVVLLALGAAGAVTLADRGANTDTVAEQAQVAVRDGSGRTVTLGSEDDRWSARVVVLPDGTAYLEDTGMPAAEPGRDLQLWSITPAGPVSAGVMRGDGEWHKFEAADAATAFAVTDEPQGGSPEPTGEPIVTGDIRPV